MNWNHVACKRTLRKVFKVKRAKLTVQMLSQFLWGMKRTNMLWLKRNHAYLKALSVTLTTNVIRSLCIGCCFYINDYIKSTDTHLLPNLLRTVLLLIFWASKKKCCFDICFATVHKSLLLCLYENYSCYFTILFLPVNLENCMKIWPISTKKTNCWLWCVTQIILIVLSLCHSSLVVGFI